MPEMTKDVNTKWSGLSSESISDIFATSAVGPGTKAMTFDNFLDDLVSTIMNTTPFIPVGNSTVSFDFLVANICAHVFELVAEIVDELSMLLSSTNSEDGQSYDQKQTYGKRGERLYSPAETDEQVSKTSSKPLDRDSGESEEGIPSTSGSPPPPACLPYLPYITVSPGREQKNKTFQYYLRKCSIKKKQISLLKNDFDTLSVQRNLKILGIFYRLFKRDNKPQYLKYLPYTWKLIELRIKNKIFKNLKTMLDNSINKKLRKKKFYK